MVEIDEKLLPGAFVHMHAMREAEKKIFLIAFRKHNGNQSKMAEYMGVTRSTVAKKLKQYDIS
ncbi:MAG: helix-turn-helix domain-containing protein [Wohlfahrtiimonas sp.]